MRWAIVGVLGLVLSTVLPAMAAPDTVRIGLYRFAPPHVLDVASPASWDLGSSGRRLHLRAGAHVVLRAQNGHVVASQAGRTVLEGSELRLDSAAPWTLQPGGTASRRFEGRLRVRAERDTLVPVLTQALEDYVRACAGDEMPPDWPAAALEAQAIATRSYALAARGRHEADGFDFCDLTHCQRYRGLAGADRRVTGAVARTQGQVLLWHARPAEVVWHAACGGWLAPNEIVFGGRARPTMRGGFDGPKNGAPWCRDAHVSRWTFETTRDRLESALQGTGLLARGEKLEGLSVRDRTPGGYAAGVRLEGAYPRAMTGYALWMALGPRFGWGDLKSPAFTIGRTGERFRFEGHGLGHGVGLCQWGARGQALAGRSAAQILAFYFPGTRLKRP